MKEELVLIIATHFKILWRPLLNLAKTEIQKTIPNAVFKTTLQLCTDVEQPYIRMKVVGQSNREATP